MGIHPRRADVELAKRWARTLLSRTGGRRASRWAWPASSAAYSRAPGLALWYHFAIMFEALFILTTVDAGTRVGRFMLQDSSARLGRSAIHLVSEHHPLVGARRRWSGATSLSGRRRSARRDQSLWPLFGIANQLLASVALCVATTILIKMGRPSYAWVTLLPLAWLAVGDADRRLSEGLLADPKLGFLAHAQIARDSTQSERRAHDLQRRLDAALALFFMAVVLVVIARVRAS